MKKLTLLCVVFVFVTGLFALDLNTIKSETEKYSKRYIELVSQPGASQEEIQKVYRQYQEWMKKLDTAVDQAGKSVDEQIDKTRNEVESLQKEIKSASGVKEKLNKITLKAKSIRGKLQGIFDSAKKILPDEEKEVEEILNRLETESVETIIASVDSNKILIEVSAKLSENEEFEKSKELAEKLISNIEQGTAEYILAENQIIVAEAGITGKNLKGTEEKFNKSYPKSVFNYFNPAYHYNRVKHAVSEWKAKKQVKNSYNKIVNRYNFAIRQRLLNPGNKDYENASVVAESQLKRVFDTKIQVFRTVDHSLDIIDFEKLRRDIENADVEDVFDSIDVGNNDVLGKIRLITYNPEAWWARHKFISEAKKSIVLTYFIMEDDIFGETLLGLLLAKAKEGVKIELMVDARGTKKYTKTFFGQDVLQEIKQYPNVDIRVYNPTHKAVLKIIENFKMIISSNHDKIIVVDDEHVIVGGRNVSMNYFVDVADDPTVFRDTDVIIQSKGVANQITKAFHEEFGRLSNFEIYKDTFWNTERETRLNTAVKCIEHVMMSKGLLDAESENFSSDEKKFIAKYNEQLSKYPKLAGYDTYNPYPEEMIVPVKILDKHGLVEHSRNDITPNLVALIDNCKEEVLIQNPYVVITPDAREALNRASNRGVKVIIHTNSPVSTDSILTQSVFIRDWKDLLKDMPNLHIFVNKGDSKLHSKVFCFDKKVSVIGTYNMDYMSEQINSEVVAVIKSEEFSKINRDAIMNDIKETAVEYKIEVTPDGEVKVVYGPEDHCPKSLLLKIKALGTLKFLTPLI